MMNVFGTWNKKGTSTSKRFFNLKSVKKFESIWIY